MEREGRDERDEKRRPEEEGKGRNERQGMEGGKKGEGLTLLMAPRVTDKAGSASVAFAK